MSAIYRHELDSYFTNISGYVFGAFLLLWAGIYTLAYNLSYSYAYFEYVIASMPFIFLVAVPILTMRVLAEERRQRTDQLLYSLPLSMGQVIMGKYLAMLTLFAIPCAIICIYPLILSAYGNIYFPTVYATMIGFIFLGAALLSIGMFISSVTDSQAVAAGGCFVVMLLLYYCTSLASFLPTTAFASLVAMTILVLLVVLIVYLMTKSSTAALILGIVLELEPAGRYRASPSSIEGLFATVMSQLSLFERMENFVNGVFDFAALVYLASVCAVFLFLCVQSMEKRRWSE